MVLGIAPVAIIDRRLPFEYTITSISTDVVVMAHPVQNINHSAFRSMFRREKLFENNFNDWFCQLKLVLRVEKKMYVIEQPLPAAPAADSNVQVLAKWNTLYDAYNKAACLMLEEGKPGVAYVLQMKGYVDQLDRLGYMLPQDIIVGLILNGLTKNFAGFVRNYNMHNIRKTIGKLHTMLNEYEKGLPKKAETLKVMMIKGGKIQKANKKSLKAKGKGKANGKGNDKQVYIPKPKNPKPAAKEHPTKDDTCHHYKEVDNCHYAPSITRGVVSVHRLVENGFVYCFTDFGISVSKNNVFYFNAIPSNGIYEIDMHDLVPNVNSIYNVSTKRAKHILDSTYLWHYHLAHISKKRIEKLQQEGLLKLTYDESFDQCVSCLSGKMTRKSFLHHPERVTDLLGIIHTDVCGPLRHVSRQDRGGEYISQEFKDYLKACGIVQQLTPPYTPQHNGVSERRNRTLLDMVRSIMNLTTLPLSFWDYALESATRILNMVPTKKVDKTPYALWYEKVPNLSYLKVWGCEALVKRDTPDKLQQRSVKCIFIGYPKETMGYYFYFPPENEIVVARYAEFFEKNLITQEVSGRAIDLEEIKMKIHHLLKSLAKFLWSLGDLNEPASYKAAMLDSESNKWIDAMNAEIQSMIDNMVWVLVDLPPGSKGYTQLYGVDYEETFSPVVDIRAIRILISIAAYYDYEIWQMDVKTAFLIGYLDEDIYMVQPEDFVNPSHPRKVCKLQRSIYGLKQASRSWNKRFDKEIKKKCFAIKDLGEASFILGIKIYRYRSKRLIGRCQNAYMDKILKRYKMDNSKRGNIPLQEKLDLNKTQGSSTPKEVKRMQNVPYALAMGFIMYVVRCTRPDVAFTQILQAVSNRILEAACAHHEDHMMHDSVQLDHVVDSYADYTNDSNIILYDQYVKDNEVPVVHSDVSSVPTDAFMMIYDDMREPHDQSVSYPSRNTAVQNSLTAELTTYKEHIELCKQRAKFELTE
nr:hypothetical protein [Tanacetum cinerariifolium]